MSTLKPSPSLLDQVAILAKTLETQVAILAKTLETQVAIVAKTVENSRFDTKLTVVLDSRFRSHKAGIEYKFVQVISHTQICCL